LALGSNFAVVVSAMLIFSTDFTVITDEFEGETRGSTKRTKETA
jgi:hypothetical protein